METTHLLLYNLNIPLAMYDTLKDYYYIPEGMREDLRENGSIILLNLGGYRKRVLYRGKYKKDGIDCHMFYKPRLTGFQRAMLTLNHSLQSKSVV